MIRHRSRSKSSPSHRENRPKPHRWRRIIWRSFLGLCLVFSIALVVIVYLLRSEPDYWKRHQAFLRSHTKQQLEALADGAEQRLEALALGDEDSSENESVPSDSPAGSPRPSGSRSVQAGASGRPLAGLGAPPTGDSQSQSTGPDEGRAADHDGARRTLLRREAVTAASSTQVFKALDVRPEDIRMDVTGKFFVSEAEMRALIAERLGEWMHSRGFVLNPAIADPMVAADDDGLLLAFEVVTPYISQVFSARFHLAFLPDGMAKLELSEVRAGELPLPADGIGWYLREQSPDNKRVLSLARWLDKLHDLRFKPVIEIAHRRRARIQSIELLDTGVRATVRIQDHLTYKETNQALAAVETP